MEPDTGSLPSSANTNPKLPSNRILPPPGASKVSAYERYILTNNNENTSEIVLLILF